MGYWDVSGEKPEIKKFWKWQKTGEIYVYALYGISDDKIEKAIEIISDVIKEYNLPLSIKKENTHKKYDFEQLIHKCSDWNDKYEIDFDCLHNEIYRLRNEKMILAWGIVIIVEETKYRFSDRKAVYGMANYDGICVIRDNYINKAMKHEFGHMIGFDDHDKCVMDYYCNYEQFCEKCMNELENMNGK